MYNTHPDWSKVLQKIKLFFIVDIIIVTNNLLIGSQIYVHE
jgi:hypothetical protein